MESYDVCVTPSLNGTSSCPCDQLMTIASLHIFGSARIELAERQLYPSAPKLFAAALYLCTENGRDTSREELQEFLFGFGGSSSARSHKLRQLLYRLTCAGIVIEAHDNFVRVPPQHVRSASEPLRALTRSERVQLPASAFIPLPGYSPAISRPFEDWLEILRRRLLREVRQLLTDDLASLQRTSEWHLAARAARLLLALDPHSYSTLCALVEALIIGAQTTEAATAIDTFLDDLGDTDPKLRMDAQRLRARISSIRPPISLAPLVGRSGTLAALSDAWSCAETGETQYVMMTGPAGIGKTRLCSALSDLLASRGVTIITHTCGDSDRHRPLSCFIRLSAQLLAMPGSLGVSPTAFSHLTRLSATEPDSADALPDAIASEIVRGEIHDALVDLFDAVSAETPLVVLVDDAHLLDLSSWAVLRSLSVRVRNRTAMLLLSARSTMHLHSHVSLPRYRTISVARLSDSDSRALFTSLAPDLSHNDTQVSEAVQLAAGNPFFLHALARHLRGAYQTDVPLDIASLAARSYHALNDTARTVLECVLALKDLATLTRVCAAALTDDLAFLRSLRLLEEDGLVNCVGDSIRCSHDLLADALRKLVPSAVAALLQQRIAAQLETECVEGGFDTALAWAAAEAWMSLGNVTAAARLLRRCAAHAAHLGEHSEAARILCRLLSVPLPTREAIALIDELITYADVGGERSIRARALRERLRHMESASTTGGASHQELSSVRIAIAEADYNEAYDLRALLTESQSVLEDETVGTELRMRAGISLLIAADLGLDRDVALSSWRRLAVLGRKLGGDHTQTLRAKLIYHTVFGNPRIGVSTARQIIRLHPLPTVDAVSVMARRNALFALQMLGASAIFKPAAYATYAVLAERKIYTEAVYIAVTLAEDAVAAGDFRSALAWLDHASEIIGRLHETADGVIQAFMSTLSLVATYMGDHTTAARLLDQVRSRLRLATSPRLRAINTTYLVRLAIRQQRPIPRECNIDQMRRDYEAGCRLGRQDTVVEGLWLAYSSVGDAQAATHLLQQYFAKYRRETLSADWCLWNSTRVDSFWEQHRSLIPQSAAQPAAPLESLERIVSRCSNLLP